MATEQSTVTYKDIEGFPGYRVGDDGSFWSCRPINGHGELSKAWRLLRPILGTNGYYHVCLYGNDRPRQLLVHRIMLTAFVGPCPDGMEGCHNDGNPKNNRLDNLRWDTPSNNQLDRAKHGTLNSVCGERHYLSKLTDDKVISIRLRYASGEATQKQLAKEHGMKQPAINSILQRKTWKHV